MVGIEIFKHFGLDFLARWGHVLAGITWIGLLYYFNFVQVPAFAELDAGARNQAVDKLASRALWWFRWAAAATFGFGILLLILINTDSGADWGTYFKGPEGQAITAGMLLGITMFLNVWLVIWPKQRIVIANARNLLAGGEADPAAAPAARAAGLASRMNTIFSFPMLFFMIGAAHFFGRYDTSSSGNRAAWYVVLVVIWGALEASALGLIGGTAAGHPTNWIFENHKRAISAALSLVVIFYAAWEIIFG